MDTHPNSRSNGSTPPSKTIYKLIIITEDKYAADYFNKLNELKNTDIFVVEITEINSKYLKDLLIKIRHDHFKKNRIPLTKYWMIFNSAKVFESTNRLNGSIVKIINDIDSYQSREERIFEFGYCYPNYSIWYLFHTNKEIGEFVNLTTSSLADNALKSEPKCLNFEKLTAEEVDKAKGNSIYFENVFKTLNLGSHDSFQNPSNPMACQHKIINDAKTLLGK